MIKLFGEPAVEHAQQTGGQLYYNDHPIAPAAAPALLVFDPGGLSCELAPLLPEGLAFPEVHGGLS